MQQQTLTADEVVTYAPFKDAHYRLVEQAHLPAAFLAQSSTAADLPLLVNADIACPFRARSQAFAQRMHLSVLVVDSWSAIFALVQQGQGVALLPRYLAATGGYTVVYPAHHYQVLYQTFQRLA